MSDCRKCDEAQRDYLGATCKYLKAVSNREIAEMAHDIETAIELRRMEQAASAERSSALATMRTHLKTHIQQQAAVLV